MGTKTNSAEKERVKFRFSWQRHLLFVKDRFNNWGWEEQFSSTRCHAAPCRVAATFSGHGVNHRRPKFQRVAFLIAAAVVLEATE
jgi:hypothetical protein